MAEGDTLLGFLKDAVNSIPVIGTSARLGWGQGNYDPATTSANPLFDADASAMERIGTVVNAIPGLPQAGEAIGAAADHFAPLKFVLDFGNRTADSFFTGAQAEDDDDSTTTFFDGWRQGWDSWGSEDHLSAGQIVGANINNGFQATGLSPFTSQGVKDTQALARTTWYGDLAGAVTDISAGFIGIPGTSVLKAARAGKTIGTLADAETVTTAFNSGQRAGKTGALFQPTSAAAQATRLEQLSKEIFDRSESATDVVNFIGPLTTASPRGTRVIAEIATDARKLGPEMGQHVIGNAMLTFMGSAAARAELMNSSPLIASKIANATMAPQPFANAALAAEKLHAQYLADPSSVNINQIVSEVMDTPRKMAEERALSGAVDKAKDEALKARELRGRMAALRPKLRNKTANGFDDANFDTARLRESRTKADAQFKDLQGRLEEARADFKADPTDAAAEQRVKDLSQRVGEARADRDLLMSTPLHDPDAMSAWKSEMTAKRRDAKIAGKRSDMLTALHRTAKRELADDAKMAREINPGLSATHDWLADLDSLGREDAILPSLRLVPSRLDRMKTAIRDEIGASYIYDAGEFNRKTIFHVMPKSWVANIGTAYGRSAINTLDRYTGAQELGMYLKKSGVYEGDEIKALTEEFHRVQPGQAEGWVARVQEDMAERIVKDEAPHLSEADVKKAVASVARGMGQNRAYLAKALEEAGDGQWAKVREFPDIDSSDAIHMVDAAYLRSHIAETAAFADPVMLRKAIKDYDSAGSLAHMAARSAVNGLDLTLGVWKMSQLLRPGLAVRNALDSNVRAYALMGTVPTMLQGWTGAKNLLRNSRMRAGDWVSVRKAKVPALEKIGAQNPAGVTRHMLNEVDFNYRGQDVKGSLYDLTDEGDISRVSVAMARSAMTKGVSPSQGLLHAGDRSGVKFTRDSDSWKIYRADSKEWPRAYADHAKVLLASPTAREIIAMDTVDGFESLSLRAVTRELFSKPAVRDEYAKLRANHNMTQEEFIQQTLRETDIMFPEPGMASDMLSGKFHGASGKQWIESHFPTDQRFNIPGEESIFRGGANFARVALDRIFKVLQDEPDFILARHPVAFNAFKKQFKKEAQALIDARLARGEDAMVTAEDIAKIQARARTHGISTVRDYMYDATRQTGVSATATLNRIVPFFAPFQDTMRAYSRLIYDDPSRLAKMAGLYNAPFNASMWTQTPFIVDEYGNALSRSERDVEGGAYVLINGEWSANKKTGRMQGRGGLALRASSFNTILQGDVPWLPGWGPAIQIPVQTALNSNDQLALYLSQSDNPAVQTLMHSLFADGEVPASDANALWKTAVPSWLRRFVDAKDGITYGRNVGYLMNSKFMEAQAAGVPFDQQRALQEAQAEATSAAFTQMIAQFGFGISGDAQVQGKFYVQKMHEFQALAVPPADGSPSPLRQLYNTDDPTAVFAQQFSEASDLTWSFTRNETGISATVKAQSAAIDLKGLIDQNPEFGWFILGGDNVGGDFSQTAYNQQRQDTYGAFQKGRKQLNPGEVAQKVRVSQGWAEFTKYTTELSDSVTSYGLDPKTAAVARKAIIAAIGQENPDWFGEYNDRANKVQDFYQRADLLANDPKLAQRQDIAMYATYRQAQQEVLKSFGLQSFAGTSANSESAKWAMYQIGTEMARQNIGFQQMWERVLSRDVEPTETQKVGADVG